MIELFDNICARIISRRVEDWLYSNQHRLRWFEYSYVTEENGMPIKVWAIFGAITYAESLR